MTRFREYVNRLRKIVPAADAEGLEGLANDFVLDSVAFIENKDRISFPTFECVFAHNTSQFLNQAKRLGVRPPQTYGCAIGTRSGKKYIIVNLGAYLPLLMNGEYNFIVNLTLVVMEELLHVLYPVRSEAEISPVAIAYTEKMLGVKIPISYKRLAKKLLNK
jgi:hypothetical protein